MFEKNYSDGEAAVNKIIDSLSSVGFLLLMTRHYGVVSALKNKWNRKTAETIGKHKANLLSMTCADEREEHQKAAIMWLIDSMLDGDKKPSIDSGDDERSNRLSAEIIEFIDSIVDDKKELSLDSGGVLDKSDKKAIIGFLAHLSNELNTDVDNDVGDDSDDDEDDDGNDNAVCRKKKGGK